MTRGQFLENFRKSSENRQKVAMLIFTVACRYEISLLSSVLYFTSELRFIFVYLLVIFILNELLLLTCKEIHFDFKLETYIGTNRIFHWIRHAGNMKWQLDIKTYRGRQQLQTGKQRQ